MIFIKTDQPISQHSHIDQQTLQWNQAVGQSLTIAHRRLDEKFIELYWQQSAPFRGNGALIQNNGTQAAKTYLHPWLEFVQSNADNLYQIGYEAGINADQSSMTSVARSGYANAVAGSAQGWIKSA